MTAATLRQVGRGNEKIGVCNCSDALLEGFRDEIEEQDREAGDDEGEISGDGGMA